MKHKTNNKNVYSISQKCSVIILLKKINNFAIRKKVKINDFLIKSNDFLIKSYCINNVMPRDIKN